MVFYFIFDFYIASCYSYFIRLLNPHALIASHRNGDTYVQTLHFGLVSSTCVCLVSTL